MLSITYFCAGTTPGQDQGSSMQASLRRSKRAGEVGSEREAWLCNVGEVPPVPIPLGVVFTVQSENSGLLHGQIGPRESQ